MKIATKDQEGFGLRLDGEGMVFQSYLGIHLGGAKSDKTVLCNLRYFPKFGKLVLQDIFEDLGPQKNLGADTHLVSMIHAIEKIKAVGLDASLQFPPCVFCKLKCPGVEACKVSEVKWMREQYDIVRKKNKKSKMPLPYTDRACEYYVNNFLEKQFELPYSLSANAAPITSRVFYLQKHMKHPLVEVVPNLSLWRIGSYLRIQKSYLKDYKTDEHCELIRLKILEAFKEKFPLFIYDQDKQRMVSNANAFEAFLCAFTCFLEKEKAVEKKPAGFPPKAGWVAIPKENLKTVFTKSKGKA